VTIVGEILYTVLLVFLLLLFFRLVMDYVFMFARSFRPTGVLAIALELAYSATDPPLKAVGKVLPPLRIGNVSLDLAFFVVLIVTYVLMNVARGL
jgi:YggT family protein